MWNVKTKGSTDITMTEGDFGVSLPFVAKGITIDSGDSVLLTVKETKNGDPVLTKTFTGITKNTIDLVFTEAESETLTVGSYIYTMDWYRGTQFLYCIVENGKLKVVDKP